MVKLKNIKKNSSVIECDFVPEDSKQTGHITFEIASKHIIDFDLPEGYEWCKNHINHAQQALVDMLDEKQLPNEKLVMWY